MAKGIVWDCEGTGLLDETTIDYTASPYKLKDGYRVHCIVLIDRDSDEILAFYDGETFELDGSTITEQIEGVTYTLENYAPVEYIHLPLSAFSKTIRERSAGRRVVGHNQINFDLLLCKLYFGMDYTIEEDTWQDVDIEFVDTLVVSKTQNPDRFGGHSLDILSEKAGVRKVEFRKHMSVDDRFKHFSADMLYYNIYDCKANAAVDDWLVAEAGNWNWSGPISLEKSVADLITRQSHRGFKFDKELAEKNIKELDTMMAERRARVEPVLPKRKATQAFMKDYTPPKNQFKMDGSLSSHMLKFIAKHNGVYDSDSRKLDILGKTYTMPLAPEPLVAEMDATIDDTTHIKEWLVSLGWNPSEYKEKDLSVDTKKTKLSAEKYEAVVDRYVEQTLNSPFCHDRCEHLNVSKNKLKEKLIKAREGKPVRVLTNPSFTKGQDKEMCPDLERIADQFAFAKDVVEYLTYKHRRNSILGGGVSWDDEEEAEKGYMAAIREDGRIATPADTCGAATSRFKHRLVTNIPRVTSLYGEPMRAMFGVDDGFFQVGYDFDSLEARIESNYCWRYEDEPKEYCKSLLLDKPNDVHSTLARKITAIIGREFARSPAKNVKYGCTYGSQAAKVAKTIGSDLETGKIIFDAFWQAAAPLNDLKDKLKLYWETIGGKKFILGIDGRKVPTRSAHAILNSLFQSGGVICAKKAMVLHEKKLKEHGYYVDFFKDDWKNMKFCQQLIAYHDEAQMEVSKSFFTFKNFTTKEEAQAFKDSAEKIWSDIKPNKSGGFYVAYCHPGELAAQAVKESGEFYKLNVELTAGYMVGRNWRDCH